MVLPFLTAAAPLIGAGLRAVGTFLSAKAASEPKVTRSEIDYVKMRESAEKAGFNPLTALRNGGGAGFAVTHHPALSAISPFGEGLQAVGGALSSFDWSGISQKRAQAEYDLLQAQLSNIQADTARMSSQSFTVPTVQGPSQVGVSGPWQTAQPEPVVGVRIGGTELSPDKGWSNTQEIEDRWGEPFSWLYGVGVAAADLWNTVDPGAAPPDFKDKLYRAIGVTGKPGTVGGGF